jgi:hypothetical protein
MGTSNVEYPTRLRKATARQASNVQSKSAIGDDLKNEVRGPTTEDRIAATADALSC